MAVAGPRPSRRAPQQFHASLPGYAPTPLHDAAALAEELGVGRVWLKDETARLGLPAFKVLGASWAVRRVAGDMLDLPSDIPMGLAQLGPGLRRRGVRALVCATDGNHGRAVARIARWMGLEARVLVPAGTARARVEAIAGEGASVEEVDGSHAEAVARSAELADDAHLLIADTSWPGYEAIPAWVVEGYGTLFWEVDAQLEAAGAAQPDLVVLPAGVGSLAAAGVRHYRSAERLGQPMLVCVEPSDAACLLASAAAGRIVSGPGPHRSIMAGLNCDTPSRAVWPELSAGVDGFLAIDDDVAEEGMRSLAAMGIAGGECAGAAVGAARELLTTPEWREALGLGGGSTVLLPLTEGVTDPDLYARLLEEPPGAR